MMEETGGFLRYFDETEYVNIPHLIRNATGFGQRHKESERNDINKKRHKKHQEILNLRFVQPFVITYCLSLVKLQTAESHLQAADTLDQCFWQCFSSEMYLWKSLTLPPLIFLLKQTRQGSSIYTRAHPSPLPRICKWVNAKPCFHIADWIQ